MTRLRTPSVPIGYFSPFAEFDSLAASFAEPAPQPAVTVPILSAASLAGKDVPPRRWVSGAQPGTFKNVNMPMVGNSADAAMHLNRVIADDKSTAFDITITTKGWFTSDGNLWMALIGKPVTLISPTLLPAGFDQSKIRIKGVTHKQNDATGTETELHLCNSEALGANPLAAPDAIDAPPAASLPDSAANPGAFI